MRIVAEDSPRGRLLAVAAKRKSAPDRLVVFFNGYGNRAGTKPGQPFDTRLECFAAVSRYDAHALWFAEEEETWYLEHEERILMSIIRFVIENRIATIKLVGASAGGYAAIRIGLLLDQRLAACGWNAVTLAFAVNPQTGFSEDIYRKARHALMAARWNPDLVGMDPSLMSSALRRHYHDRVPELAQFGEGYRPTNFAIVILNDDGNPLERVFAEELLSWDFVLQMPQNFGLGHRPGCVRLIKEHLWQAFDVALPFGTTDVPLEEPVLLP